jgi:hypothetical protein
LSVWVVVLKTVLLVILPLALLAGVSFAWKHYKKRP